MSDAASILALLDAARRRRRMVIFARVAWLSVPTAAGLAAVAEWLLRPASVGLGAALAVATVLAFLVAAGAAVLRTPSRRDVAAALDGRLQLEDRLVTAMACVNAPDPVARLVLRDTAARIADIRLARVFPFEMPARLAWVLLASAGAVALASGGPDSTELWSANRTGNGIITPGGRSSGAPSRGQIARNPGDAASERPGTLAARSAAGATAPLDATRVQASDRSSPSNTRESGADARTPAGATPAPPPSSVQAGDARGSGNNARPASSGNSGRSGTTGAAGNAVTAKGSSGRAQGASLSTVSAGGITGGTLTARPPDDRALMPLDRATYAARYAEAWSQAQVAIGHAEVPAAMRDYVKRYFASIHPDRIK